MNRQTDDNLSPRKPEHHLSGMGDMVPFSGEKDYRRLPIFPSG